MTLALSVGVQTRTTQRIELAFQRQHVSSQHPRQQSRVAAWIEVLKVRQRCGIEHTRASASARQSSHGRAGCLIGCSGRSQVKPSVRSSAL